MSRTKKGNSTKKTKQQQREGVEKIIKDWSHAASSMKKYKGNIELFKKWATEDEEVDTFDYTEINEDLCYKICLYMNDRGINNSFSLVEGMNTLINYVLNVYEEQ